MHAFKKIICSFLIVTILVGGVGFVQPQRANALFGAGDIVSDPGNTVQGAISAVNTGLSSFANYSLNYKELVLDGIINMIVKGILQRLTSSVVNWINSGFKGNPSFVTDSAGFFADIGGELVGKFVSNFGPLSGLCSPFSIDLRLALAFKYRPYQRKYSCTLNDIIKNVKNAGENASINGFTAGDFKQGRWPAFVSLSTEPQNNVYGAYLQADSDIRYQIGKEQGQKQKELDQGRGFLSWKNCVPDTTSLEANEAQSYAELFEKGTPERIAADKEAAAYQKCTTETPGSVIAGVLDKQLGAPTDQLNLADEFNEIVNALFAQLVTTVLQGGLRAASGGGASDPNAYINQLQKEQTASNNSTLATIRTKLIENVTPYLANAQRLKTSKDTSLALVLDTKSTYDAVKSCFNDKIVQFTANTNMSQAQKDQAIQAARAKIAETDGIINSQVAPVGTPILQEANAADAQVAKLKEVSAQANAAQTVNDINTPSTTFAGYLERHELITGNEIANAEAQTDTIRAQMTPLKTDALRRLQACQLYNGSGSISN